MITTGSLHAIAAAKIPFTLRLRENQYVSREGCATWTRARYRRRAGASIKSSPSSTPLPPKKYRSSH
ncbi:MAG: hypothetical protein P8Y47_10175 [Alphaproteobacteria bacterium]